MDINISTTALTATDVENSVQSFNASMRLVKRVCKIGLLNILYRRLKVDKKGFEGKRHKGTPYVIYVRKTDNPIIRMYHSWIYGIIDAIEKNYLESVYLFFVNKDTENVLEHYRFLFKYNQEELSMNMSEESLEEQTDKLFKFLLDLKDIPKLDGNVEPRIELRYKDDTPEDYDPPNFSALSTSLMTNIHLSEVTTFENMNTDYYQQRTASGGVNVELRSTQDHSLIEIDDTQMFEENALRNFNVKKGRFSEVIEFVVLRATNVDNQAESPEDHPTNLNNTNYDHIWSTEDFTEPDFECHCNVNDPSLNLEIFECAKCTKYYHNYCVGIYKNTPKNYQCFKCNPHGDNLSKIPPAKHEMFTKTRIVLALFYKNSKFPVELFKRFTKKKQEHLFTMLKKINVITGESTADNFEVIEPNFTSYVKYLFKDMDQMSS